MHPGIFSTAGDMVFLPVRHHSPACARAVREVIVALRPAAILIEGPSDFNDRMGELALPHTLPIAIYSYVQLGGVRRGAFYPFCEHSPEWEALRAGRELGAALRFIDMPWADMAAPDVAAHRYADAELRENPYIPALCARAGVDDFDALWDTLAEIDPALTPAQLFERVHRLCYHIRASGGPSAEDLRREAFMAQQIRAARAELAGPLLVITGGFHSYALYAQLHGLAPLEAAAPPDTAPSPTPDERGIALTPYTELRLDSLSGYEAGMPSPGFYRQIWGDRQRGERGTYRTLLASAAVALRRRGQIASTADLIAVETSARALADLRGHAEVWRQDLIDGIISALIKEAAEPGHRNPFLDALREILRGDQRGRLADGVALPPLVGDIERQLREHGLTPGEQQRRVQLDLEQPADLARSRVLHQLRVIGVSGFSRAGGTDFVARDDLVTIWEDWQIVWTPDFDANCIESAIYGTTLAEAAWARLIERAGGIERSAAQAALALLDACLMGLGERTAELIALLSGLVGQDGDFFSLTAALGHVLYLYRYDHTLGAVGSARIGGLLAEIFERSLWQLAVLGRPQGQDRELVAGFQVLLRSFESCEHALGLSRADLVATLRQVAASTSHASLARGAATGAMWALGEAPIDQVRADMRAFAAPDVLGDFLAGLFALARETVQRHAELLAGIDALLMDFDGEEFLHALPALRLAFSFFTPREKAQIAQTLVGDADSWELTHLDVDITTAARAHAAERRLLAMMARFGIRGGEHG
ncbi:hypothetical protein F8S13_07470 [Chloroflexia bacterium SDU3-3]|nr:hypothetical protein F8S13_07470 [Chloroflexia bacterium SDU3-3]